MHFKRKTQNTVNSKHYLKKTQNTVSRNIYWSSATHKKYVIRVTSLLLARSLGGREGKRSTGDQCADCLCVFGTGTKTHCGGEALNALLNFRFIQPNKSNWCCTSSRFSLIWHWMRLQCDIWQQFFQNCSYAAECVSNWHCTVSTKCGVSFHFFSCCFSVRHIGQAIRTRRIIRHVDGVLAAVGSAFNSGCNSVCWIIQAYCPPPEG